MEIRLAGGYTTELIAPIDGSGADGGVTLQPDFGAELQGVIVFDPGGWR